MRLDKWAAEGANKTKKVHFVGVGGSGMCGLAEILCELGYKVSGSDAVASDTLTRLAKIGVKCYVGHKASQVKDVDLIVRSGAIADDNIELHNATKNAIPIIQRAEMLADIMRFGFGIAVAGSHGKTTTTSMMAKVLAQSGEDVTFIVGGLVKSSNSNAKLGSGKYVVAEADESDASFLFLHPVISLVTNIDAEHMYMYGDINALKQAFIEFLHHLPFDGLAVVCIDDPALREIEDKINRPLIKYGFSADADYRIKDVQQDKMQTSFTIVFPDKKMKSMTLQVPGKHNVLNATACIATACFLGMKPQAIAKALNEFRSVSRRQDILGSFSGSYKSSEQLEDIMLIDDYGHHPTEIKATLQAIKDGWPHKRCVMIFQPHRYSRTQELFDDFVKVLAIPEQVLILDIYPAGEKPVPGINAKKLVQAIASKTKAKPIYVKDATGLVKQLPAVLNSGDMLITQGAGDIGNLAQDLSNNSLYLKVA